MSRLRRAQKAPGDQAERALFFRHWLRRPFGMGAMLPSGPAVARAIARELSLERLGDVLELGGGTGSITRALLAAGCPPERLIVVEREPRLAALLREHHPALRVVDADACRIDDVLTEHGITRLSSVISSLPIKWFPLPAQRDVVGPCLDRLGPGGRLIQLTNAFASPLQMKPLRIEGAEVARLWGQFPPVQIWRYWRPVEMPRAAEEKAARWSSTG